MIDTLRHYYPNSVPAVLETAAGLRSKVNPDGKLLPFPGNTVVFLLDGQARLALRSIQDSLYEKCGFLLADRLVPDTFHMTLHDLANEVLLPQREQMAAGARTILDEIRAAQMPCIPMKATWTFNMVNTSIVLGLQPKTDSAWQQLDDLYCRFQQVRHLSYALTPHITLAYFRPGCYGSAESTRLRDALGSVDLETELDINRLVLQDFDHMNAYKTVY